MGDFKECPTVSLLMVLYVVNTILLYISLKGNKWVTYERGHSGLWNHCNITGHVHNTTNSTEETCHYIHMPEASAGLHFVRAFYIIGFIIWCLGMLHRYLTWRHRGTDVDKPPIYAAMLCGLLVSSAAFLFTFGLYEWDYVSSKTTYVDPGFGVDHSLSFVCASLAILLGFFSIRLHRMLNSETSSFSWAKHFPCLHPGSRLKACCGKRDTRPQAAPQQSSRATIRRQTSNEASVISTDNPGYSSSHSNQPHSLSSLQHSLGILGAVFSVQRAAARSERSGRERRQSEGESGTSDTADGVSVVSASGISEWSSRRSGEERNQHHRHMPPVDVMTLPPTYDEVIRDDGCRQDNNTINPPPAYDDVIANRELILTPPPSYQESYY